MSNYIKLNKKRRLTVWSGKPVNINYLPRLCEHEPNPSSHYLGWARHPETGDIYTFYRAGDGRARAQKKVGESCAISM